MHAKVARGRRDGVRLYLHCSIKQDFGKTKWKTMNLSITLCTIRANNDIRNISINEVSKTAVNACVVKFAKAQRNKNGITHCTITVCNFSMRNKLLQYSIGKLQQENH